MSAEQELKLQRLLDSIEALIEARVKHDKMHEEEHQWIKLQMKQEALDIELKQAIITKIITGGVWGATVGLAAAAWMAIKHSVVS
jgi:hypothetical protein